MRKLRFRRRTPHQTIEVYDDESAGRRIRRLFLDSVEHSAVDLDHPSRPVWVYTDFVHLARIFTKDPKRVLVAGLGGGVMPMSLRRGHPRAEIEVVEIDPGVVSVAGLHFGVEAGVRLRIHVDDARRFLRRTDRLFDLVVLDVFQSRGDDLWNPSPLLSAGFFMSVKARLSPDGVVVFNLIGRLAGKAGPTLAVIGRLERIFPQVYLFPIFLKKAPNLEEARNIMIVCTMSGKRLGARAVMKRAKRIADGGPAFLRRLPWCAENYLSLPSRRRARSTR